MGNTADIAETSVRAVCRGEHCHRNTTMVMLFASKPALCNIFWPLFTKILNFLPK